MMFPSPFPRQDQPDAFRDWMIPSVHTDFLLVIVSNAMKFYDNVDSFYNTIWDQSNAIAMLAVSEFEDYREVFEAREEPVDGREWEELFLRPVLFFRFFREILGSYVSNYGLSGNTKKMVSEARKQAELFSKHAASNEIDKRMRILDAEMREQYKREGEQRSNSRASKIRSLHNELKTAEQDSERRIKTIKSEINQLAKEEIEYQKKRPKKGGDTIGV